MKRPAPPPPIERLMKIVDSSGPEGLTRVFAEASPVDDRGQYLHWDKLRYLSPPEGLTTEEWWLGTKISRRAGARSLPLRDSLDSPFRFTNVNQVQQIAHQIDQEVSGHILVDDDRISSDMRNRFLMSSMVEEAITSSQLEGASTTRRVAKEMLESGRQPVTDGERMIRNNYQALLEVEKWVDEGVDFSPTRIQNLHRIVTAGTLEDPRDAGRFQQPDDDRVSVLWSDQTLLHQPPAAETVPERIEELCEFANVGAPDGFIHPVVQAILIHFQLAYVHPFADGNGRTARALFYWSLLRSGYWLAQFLPISSIIRREPKEYTMAYMYVDTDDRDTTYFVLYQLDVLYRALGRLRDYIARKMKESRELADALGSDPDLNHRQIAMIRDVLRDPTQRLTFGREQRRHRISYPTARSDLLGLEERGLLLRTKVGKKFVFRAAPNLEDRLGG